MSKLRLTRTFPPNSNRNPLIFLVCLIHGQTTENAQFCCCLVAKSCLTLLWLHGLQSPGCPVHGIFQARTFMHAQSLQLCQTLCEPVECSLPGSSVHEIFQATILEWISMPSSRGPSWPRDWTRLSMSPTLADGFFTTSATWEDPAYDGMSQNVEAKWECLTFNSYPKLSSLLIHVEAGNRCSLLLVRLCTH